MSQSISLSPLKEEDDVFELTEIVSDTFDTSKKTSDKTSREEPEQAEFDPYAAEIEQAEFNPYTDDITEQDTESFGPHSAIEGLIDTLDPPTSRANNEGSEPENEFDSLLDGLLDETTSPDSYAAKLVNDIDSEDTEVKDSEETDAADLDFLDALIDSTTQEKIPDFLQEQVSTDSISSLLAASENTLDNSTRGELSSTNLAETLTLQGGINTITTRLDVIEARFAGLDVTMLGEQVPACMAATADVQTSVDIISARLDTIEARLIELTDPISKEISASEQANTPDINTRLSALEAQGAKLDIATISAQVMEQMKATIEKAAATAAATILREEIQALLEAMGDEDAPQ